MLQRSFAWLKAFGRRVLAFVLTFFWLPTDLPGCRLWLRSNRGVIKAGSLVTAWVDQVDGRLLAAPGIVERPAFVPSVEAFGERSAVRFSGVGEVLELDGDVGLPFGDAPFSVFAVIAQAGVGVADGTVVIWEGAAPHVGIWITSSNVFEAILERIVSSGVTLLSGRAYLVGITYAEQKATLYVNGVAAKTFTGVALTSPSGSSPHLAVGAASAASNGFRGDIGEIVIYDRALDDAEARELSAELMEYYGIGLTAADRWLRRLGDWLRERLARVGSLLVRR